MAAVIGTAGDRPDDTLRGIGRIAAGRVRRLALKETIRYLRGRSRESVIAELRAGALEGGWHAPMPLYGSEPAALAGELDREVTRPEVLVVLCHAERDELFAMLADRGFRPVAGATELAALVGGS